MTLERNAALQRINRVLIVEDNALISLDFQLMLEDLGVSQVDVATDLDRARELTSQGTYDVAVLDVKIGDDYAFDLARALCDQKTQIMFVSGFSLDQDMPDDLRGMPFFEKPLSFDKFVGALTRTDGGPTGDTGA